MKEIAFRSIKPNDLEFLWQLHNLTLKEYITQTWGWDEDWQWREFVRQFNPAIGKIIVVDGADAGFLWVSEKPTEIKLVSIRLLPQFQKLGLGTQVIRDLISNARAQSKCVILHVLKVNPARRLYERLGFAIAEELENHFLMRTV